jgi:hypothetical protein
MIVERLSSPRSGMVSKVQEHRLEENGLPVPCPPSRPVHPFSAEISVSGVVCSVRLTVR